MRASFHGGGWALLALLLCLPLAACGSGDDGANGQPGASTGLLVGQVLNALTGDPIVGAIVTTTPTVDGVFISTDTNGEYEARLPIGAYQLECMADNYVDGEDGVSILAAETSEVDFDLDPVAPVIVTIVGAPSSAMPGVPFTLTVETMIMDGSVITGYDWDQLHGTDADIQSPGAVSTVIEPAGNEDYKEDVIDNLTEYTGELDRYRVVGINPHALEGATELEFEVTVMTTSGDHHDDVGIPTDLPFASWATGVENVPTGVPVLLSGPDNKAFDWSISGPGDPVLNDPQSRYPWFVPAAGGRYKVFDGGMPPALVGDGTTGMATTQVLEVYAADWVGGIGGVDGDVPMMNAGCTNACHAGILSEVFDDWSETGHAHIFTTQLNTSDHYGPNCFPCHNVGYDTSVMNNGMDDQDDYAAFLAWAFPGGHGHPDAGNFQYMLDNFPDSAKLSNIQCENCHGPNGSTGAHASDSEARMSLSSDVCAYCHGEPPRHARFQQWEESGHSNYELAIDESGGSCQDCHTAQGWLAASPGWATMDGESGKRPNPESDEVHPQTCALCHDPHNIGSTSGFGTNAPMRIQGSAYNLASGFDATSMGKGAMCATCHNGRRGLVNDDTGLPNADRAPHGGPQTDVLFGENAFFVDVGYRGAHSFLGDTCVTCHMELTPPPAELSYNLSGTNHTFEASLDVCSECHGAFDGGTLKEQFEMSMEELEAAILARLYQEIGVLLGSGYTVQINGHAEDNEDELVSFTIDSLDDFEPEDMALTESHGRTAIDVTYAGQTAYGARLGSGDPQGTLILLGEMPVPNLSGDSEFGSLVSNGLFQAHPDMDQRPEVLIAQAAYNYFLLHNDGSSGFHYPSFAGEVLVNTGMILEDEIEWYFRDVLLVGTGAGGVDSTLYMVDPENDVLFEIGDIDGNIRGMEFDRSTGVLYGTPAGDAAQHEMDLGLYEVDIYTGEMTEFAADWTRSSPDLTFSDGVLYGSPGGSGDPSLPGLPYFGSISTSNGAWTDLGTDKDLEFEGGSGFAANDEGDAYWYTGDNLYSVDLSTGDITEIASNLDYDRVYSMTFFGDMLIGLTRNSLLVIDPTDGSAEEIFDLSDIGDTCISMAAVALGLPMED